MAGLLVVLSVVSGTLLWVVASERINRREMIRQRVKEQTQTLEQELLSAKQSLDAINRMSAMKDKELVEARLEIKRLRDRLPLGMSSVVEAFSETKGT